MGLPIQSTPTYKCVLPNSGEEVSYRHFLEKEQTLLTRARESEDQKQIFNAIKTLIEGVTFNKVVADDLAVIDLEWLFLKVRSVSVGETSTVNVGCYDKECNGSVKLTVNLDEITVTETNEIDNKIMINDNVGIILSAPIVKDVGGMSEDKNDIVEILKVCIESIFDEENVYEANETSDKDLDEFIGSLTFQQLELMSSWFESLPKLSHKVSGKCGVCDKTTTRTLEGIASFF